MADPNRSVTTALDCEAILSWDLTPDERAPPGPIIMRFANYKAAHTILTKAGFTPVSGSAHVLRHPDERTAVQFTDLDGSTVVLAQPLAAGHGSTER